MASSLQEPDIDPVMLYLPDAQAAVLTTLDQTVLSLTSRISMYNLRSFYLIQLFPCRLGDFMVSFKKSNLKDIKAPFEIYSFIKLWRILYMKYDAQKIGNRIREMRKHAGYKSQAAFGDALKPDDPERAIDRKTIARWEDGERLPDLDTMLQMCDLFNCDLDYLLGTLEAKTHDIQFIMNKTGLSEHAVNVLIDYRDFENEWGDGDDVTAAVPNFISFIVEDKRLHILLEHALILGEHVATSEHLEQRYKNTGLTVKEEPYPFSRRDIINGAKYTINRDLSQLVDEYIDRIIESVSRPKVEKEQKESDEMILRFLREHPDHPKFK